MKKSNTQNKNTIKTNTQLSPPSPEHKTHLYSSAEIQKIITLQNAVKANLSRKRTKKKTASDLGEKNAIDIVTQPHRNLKNIKERLREAKLLPARELKDLNEERKLNHYLSPEEVPLFEVLLNKKYILQHTSASTTIQKVLAEGKVLLDPMESKRRTKEEVKTATPEFGGIEHNIFLGLGSKNSTLPLFVRTRFNSETKKFEDYSTIQIDFTKLSKMNPNQIKNSWCSGHFAHYATAIDESKMLPVTIGSTQFYWSYAVENPLQLGSATPVKYLNFVRPDGFQIKQRIGIADEIAYGNDIIPFFALCFIERLRFVGGDIRQHLLANSNDDRLIDLLIEKLFRVNDFEMHIPTQLLLHDEYTTIISPEERLRRTAEVFNAVKNNQFEQVQSLHDLGYPLDGYMYQDRHIEANLDPITLPLSTAIQNKSHEMIKLLIRLGANREFFHRSETIIYNSISDQDHHITLTFLSILQEVVQAKDIVLFNDLLAAGFNINYYYHSELKQKIQEVPKLDFGGLNSLVYQINDEQKQAAKSDLAFTSVIAIVRKNKAFDMLKRFIELSDYCRDANNKSQILLDIAREGDPQIFDYWIRKNNIRRNQIDFAKLINTATSFGNNVILPFLFAQTIFLPSNSHDNAHSLILSSYSNGYPKTTDLLIQEFNHELDKDILNEMIKSLKEPRDVKSCLEMVEFIYSHFKLKAEEEKNLIRSLCYGGKFETLKSLLQMRKFSFINKDRINLIISMVLDSNSSEKFEFAQYLVETYFNKVDLFLGRYPKIHQKAFQTLLEDKDTDGVLWCIKNGYHCDADDLMEIMMHGEEKIISMLHIKGIPTEYQIALEEKKSDRITIKIDSKNLPQYERYERFLKYCEEEYKTIMYLYNVSIINQNAAALRWLTQHYKFFPECFIKTFYLFSEKNGPHYAEILEILITHGMNLDTYVEYNDTFIKHYLNFNSLQKDVIDLFEKNNVDFKRYMSLLNKQIFTRIFLIPINPDLTILSWLCKQGASLTQCYKDTTYPLESKHFMLFPLQAACSTGHVSLVQELLNAGADVNAFVDPNLTPLHIACGAEMWAATFAVPASDEMIQLLLDQKPILNIGEKNALTILCEKSHPDKLIEKVDLLLKANEDVNYGIHLTPLTAAIKAKNIQLVNHLLLRGANPNKCILKDTAWISPLYLVWDEIYDDTLRFSFIELLHRAGANPHLGFNEDQLQDVINWADTNNNLLPLMSHLKPSEDKETKIEEPYVILTTALAQSPPANTHFGIADYAKTLAHGLLGYTQITKVEFIPEYNDALEKKVAQICNSHNECILHVLLEAAHDKKLELTPEKLKQLKENHKNIKIIITIIRDIHFSIQENSVQLPDILSYLEMADEVILTHTKDRIFCLEIVKALKKETIVKLPPLTVIPAPATVVFNRARYLDTHKAHRRTNSNILSFTALCREKDKQFSGLIDLATQLRDSDHPKMKKKKIYIVDTLDLNEKYYENEHGIYELLCAIYPSHANKIRDMQIFDLIEYYQSTLYHNEHPELPIELFINISNDELYEIFSNCIYALSLNASNYSLPLISTIHKYQFIIYDKYTESNFMISMNPGDRFVTVPETKNVVYDNILEREENEQLNLETYSDLAKLNCDVFDLRKIAIQTANVYNPNLYRLEQKLEFKVDESNEAKTLSSKESISINQLQLRLTLMPPQINFRGEEYRNIYETTPTPRVYEG